MITFANRNFKLFFRDKSAVFFSLLAVFIIIGLYALFLGEVWMDDNSQIKNARFIMDSWLIAGLMAVTSVTTTMGAFTVIVDDKCTKISKDFFAAPIKRSSITGGYITSAFLIGVIMSLVTLVIAEIYICVRGGELLGIAAAIKVFGLILLTSMSNTASVCFIVSFFKSQSAFATASTIISTLIGFITGIYLPLGSLPEVVQTVVKVFPVSHAAALFRQVIMEAPLNSAFSNAPVEYFNEFNDNMGVVFRFGNYTVSPFVSVIVLALSAILFYGLATINMSRKSR